MKKLFSLIIFFLVITLVCLFWNFSFYFIWGQKIDEAGTSIKNKQLSLALKQLQQGLSISKYIIKPDKLKKASQYFQIGLLHLRLKDYCEAQYSFQKSLPLLGDLYQRQEGLALFISNLENLAICFYEQNQVNSYIDCLEHVMNIHKQFLGNQHPQTIAAMIRLASGFENLGQLEQATVIYQKIINLPLKWEKIDLSKKDIEKKLDNIKRKIKLSEVS